MIKAVEELTLVSLGDVTLSDTRLRELDEIFFSSSNKKSFASGDAKAAFRQRWLGRYLDADLSCCFVAIDAGGSIVGYILSGRDEVVDGQLVHPLNTALGYSVGWTDHVVAFPAHLHINIREDCRGLGLGEMLVEHLVGYLRSQNVPGVHLLTSADSRNVRFYRKCGFSEQARGSASEDAVVFLGKAL